jgi:hypothetical protein
MTVRHALLVVTLLTLTSAHGSKVTAQDLPFMIGSTTPLEQATDIKAQPLAVLAKFPEAGVAMARYVAELVAKQPSLVDAVLSIVNVATPQQAAAIGAGLVRSVRALGVNDSQTPVVLTRKIMKSDSMWMKKTFAAIGPNYNVKTAPLIIPEPLPIAPLSNAPVGQMLPLDKGRIGPSRISTLLGYNGGLNNNPLLSEGSRLLNRHGMIVAIMASDNKKNGAVSTSPTH